MNDILVNLADNYPQAPSSGGTLLIKEVITEVNRADDESIDLLFANQICIGDYLQEDEDYEAGDYTEFIIRVVNTAIGVTQQSQEVSRERTVREIFNQFNEQLFWLSQQSHYQPVINRLDDRKKSEEDKHTQLMRKKLGQDIVCYFSHTLERNAQ